MASTLALRIFGVGLVLIGATLGIVAYKALSGASDMGQFMAQAGEALGQPVDAVHWTARWRANGVGIAIVAAGALFAGLSFIMTRRSGWAVLAAALAANTMWLFIGRVRGEPEYAFEADLSQIVASAILTTFCAWTAWRSRHAVAR